MLTQSLPFDETNLADLRTWSRQAEQGYVDLPASRAIPQMARNLIKGLITRSNRRLTAKQALQHQWLKDITDQLLLDDEHLMMPDLQTDPEECGRL
jgi:hypothetical protein